MRVRVLLFGAEALAMGRDAVEIELGADRTCRALRQSLAAACPELGAHLPSGRVALNGEFAPAERQIREGDEVALIGLVGGG